MKHISEIDCCPYCGHDEYYTKQRTTGTIQYAQRFDGEEADNTDMYEGLSVKEGKRAYCRICNRTIAEI